MLIFLFTIIQMEQITYFQNYTQFIRIKIWVWFEKPSNQNYMRWIQIQIKSKTESMKKYNRQYEFGLGFYRINQQKDHSQFTTLSQIQLNRYFIVGMNGSALWKKDDKLLDSNY
ncbi:unnamed protein product [Paramecium octaurelia]|uniref:Uncharacterized protein n=1 Tax=Paramecium octaurelia TaxID=43137 RepID=A0A8S1X1X2_PAROT|nr:unnamed protein product [Paramecium octaurelia]